MKNYKTSTAAELKGQHIALTTLTLSLAITLSYVLLHTVWHVI